MTRHRLLHVEFLVPAVSENRWSETLASLIATDPGPIARLVGVTPDEVRREVPVVTAGRKVDRVDLLLLRGGQQVVAIEAKLYADLGTDQLHRYSASLPGVEHRFVLHLAGLPYDLRRSPGWKTFTWEVLTAYTASEHPWVQATASAWPQYLPSLVPHVDGDTVWDDVPDTPAGFDLAPP